MKPAKLAVLALVLSGCATDNADVLQATTYRNDQTGLLTWSAESHGFSLELIQLLPDFVRAVYGSHGFPKNEIETIAGYCVFGTVVKNTAQKALSYRVSDWRYRGEDGVSHPLRTKTQWLAHWRKAGITFSWTLLPDAVTFEVGDWQQGFTTVKLRRNERFDFTYTWTLGNVVHTATLKNLQCPPEDVVVP